MCGIIGYIGNQNAKNIIINGLKKLEYRGYDSFGICLKEKNSFIIKKVVGSIENKEYKLNKIKLNTSIGIGHTRWATHGKVNIKNTHPHFDKNKEFVVVHNGIIENYLNLKKELIKNKENFYSETDSEVIPKLIAREFRKTKNFNKAIFNSANNLKGSYGICILHKYSNSLIAIKNGSNVNIIKTENGVVISSDINAILDAKEFVSLDDKEIAIIKDNVIEFFNFNGKKVNKKSEKINNIKEIISKEKYSSFTEKEIYEQAKVINNIIKKYIINKKIIFKTNINFKKINRIIIVAHGTSYNAGLIGKYYFESISKIPTQVEYSSEFNYNDVIVDKKTLIIGISQSGETADTINAIKKAKKLDSKTISIVNTKNSSIEKASDNIIYLNCGPEIGVASTKAFTSNLIILYLFAKYISKENNFLSKSEINDLYKLINKIKEIFKLKNKLKKVSKKITKKKVIIFAGRGLDYPISLEASLKLKEINYINSIGIAASEFKHGTLSLVDKTTLSIFSICDDFTIDKTTSNLEEVCSRNGQVSILSTKKIGKNTIKIPKTNYYLQSILLIIAFQIIAIETTKILKKNPDKPRNLAKSVTVE